MKGQPDPVQKRLSRETLNEIEMAVGIRTAILVDGAFFLKRYSTLYQHGQVLDPKIASKDFYTMVHKHVEGKSLYRIFYYDSLPLIKRVHLPISHKSLNFANTPLALFRLQFIEELKRLRKVALRLGSLKDHNRWVIKPEVMKEILKGEIQFDELLDENFFYDVKQKGVDIRIGLDIASLAYKRLVQQIILISGDSDFVPAAKVARREGIDFILDPMWNRVDPALFEHIDGMKSVCPKPKKQIEGE
jgi:uncharacterized LabA/DUF88 family protein